MALLTEDELERLCGHFHAYGTDFGRSSVVSF
jgi:hypothetical protein